jgi:hypothetical protein
MSALDNFQIDDLKVAGVIDAAQEHRMRATVAGLSLLTEAISIVEGPRQACYGHPIDDFAVAAAIWTAILGSRLKTPLTAQDIPLLMIGLKLARQAYAHKHDNLVDIAGYAATAEMCAATRAKP